MNNKFLRNLQIGFGLSFLLLLISAFAAFISIKGLMYNKNEVDKTEKIISSLETIISTLKDSETGQRGYLITKDTRFLKPYYTSLKSIPVIEKKFESLIKNNPEQLKNWEDLHNMINKRTLLLDKLLIQRKTNQEISLAQLLRGNDLMDSCRLLTNRMKSIEKKSLAIRTERANLSSTYTPIILLISAFLSLLITVLYYLKIRSDFKTREILRNQLIEKDKETAASILKIEEIAHQISLGDYSTRVEGNVLGILSKLSVSLNEMASSLEKSFNILNDNEWLQKGIVKINENLLGNKTVEVICEDTLNQIITYTECENGGIYLYEKGKLVLKKAYAKADFMKPVFDEGEGLIGQAFADGSFKTYNNLDDSYTISHANGDLKIKHLVIIPIKHDEITIGVMQLGCFREFTDIDIQLYKECVQSIGSAVNSSKSRRHIQNLLEETQAQSEELQAQHNELENLNSELAAQTQKLQASEEELRVQQEELLQSNQELEERSKLLEERNQLIIDRNLEIQRKSEELELSTKYKSEFLANMSHELRTPLNSILLLSRLTAENPEGNLNEEQIESAKVIQSSGHGLLNLIDEILDLSKIEAGKMEVYFEPTLISSITTELKNLFDPVAKDKRIDFIINVEKTLLSFETDEIKLGQVLKNLISNAIKFTPKGSVTLDIQQNKEQIILKVIDTGIGIDKDKQKLIFEAFQQADGSTKRKFGGTGLGLSISRELVKLLGGEILVESVMGKGSIFTLIFPLANEKKLNTTVENVTDDSPIIKPESYKSFTTDLIPEDVEDDRAIIIEGDKVILIVEDDTVFAKTLLNYARKNDYKGIVVVRGDLALPATLEYQPRAILLDIQLPIMDGWMIMDQLKSHHKTKHIPVHMMSSLQAKKESLLKGAVDFINKPFAIDQMSDVFKKIEAALNKSPKKVLIIEENTKHANALSYFLGNFNVSSEIKNSVSESTKALQEKNVDCVILDMGVPYETAYETLEIIRQNPGLENLPIIIFTGKNISKVEELKIKKYADSIILKTAHSYQRVLDEVGLFLHLVDDEKNSKPESSLKKLGNLTEVIKGKTVLIADDDVRNIFSLSKALEKHGMNVISAIDGKEAINKLKENPNTDIILMDIMMPEMDGYETISTIRKDPLYKKLPIFAVTAKAMIGDREKCIKVGASDYISKPVDIDQLLSLLRVWLFKA